ncbi:MAG: SurA N-terminal domain-containing protein [Bacteroidales bacterium]|nr:SurA N-terminal domain-containing protein [Bacteroidales bacterium]
MSAIQFLREKAGVFVAGAIGLSLFLFVVSDFFGNGRTQRIQARKYYEMGEIAGKYISYQDFEERVQSLFEIYKLSGTTTIDEATAESIREQVWQQMVREKIQDEQFRKLGIDVSTEEVDELVLGNNPHPIVTQLFTDQSTGIFNRSFLVNFLKQIELDETSKRYWLFFEDEIVKDRMNTKYNNLVSKGLYATTRQAEFDKTLNSSTVDFSFIMKNYSAIPDSSVTIQQSDLELYYSEHKDNYKRNALRDIEYVIFEVLPSEDDIKQAEQWINKTREEFAAADDPVQFINLTADTRHTGFYVPLAEVPENLREFVKKEDLKSVFGPYQEDGSFKIARLIGVAERPDSVHARHILLAPNQTRSSEQTRAMADSLVRLIKSGSPFEALAIANSDDQGSAQIGGDLGWFPEGRMVVPFNNACFTAKKGEIVTAETNYGIHIIEILEESKNSRKYDVGIVDRKILASSATNQRIYSEASQFAGTNDTYDKFTASIAAQNLTKRVANDVIPTQKALPGLENPRSLVISLFSTDAGKIVLDNSEQAVFEVGNNYVVGFCTKAQEEGIAPIKDVESEIRFDLLREKKAELISGEFAKNKEPGKTLDDIAREMGLTVQEATQITFRSYTLPGVGNEPALVAAASAAKQGIVTGPVTGNNGVYMFFVNGITIPEGEDLKLLRERLMSTLQMRGSYEAYEALRKGANIVDKRYKFY